MTPEEKAAANGARDIAANVTDGRNSTAQLRYAITLALDTFSGQPLDLSEYPFYKPSAHE